MTRIKLCGLSRLQEIQEANRLMPQYIGFVFAPKSRRYIEPQKARELKKHLHPAIKAVGVFVNEEPKVVAEFLNSDVIDMAQLHGNEDESYICRLRAYTNKPLIQAFSIKTRQDAEAAEKSSAEYVLLDSGAGTGVPFDWKLIHGVKRPYFLAGGLGLQNVEEAVRVLKPYAVDVSSGIETDGQKDRRKMADFVAAVRKGDQI